MKKDRSLLWGALLTAAYLGGIVVWVLLGKDNNGASRWHEFTKLPLNNIGDFLAGVFSPVAFLWLVLGYFQQGRELRLQAEELRHSVDAQRQLVQVAREEHAANLKSIELEHEKMAAEQRERSESARPRFFFQDGMSSKSGNTQAWERHLNNAGRTCTQVRLDFEGDEGLRLVGQQGFPYLAPQHAVNVNFRLEPIKPRSGKLKISYVDALGESGRAEFEVRAGMDEISFVPISQT